MRFSEFIATVGISGSKDSSSLTSVRDSSTGSMSSPMGTVSRFRVVVGLANDALCQIRFPIVDWFSQKNLLVRDATVGFFILHFPVQIEIGVIILETLNTGISSLIPYSSNSFSK